MKKTILIFTLLITLLSCKKTPNTVQTNKSQAPTTQSTSNIIIEVGFSALSYPQSPSTIDSNICIIKVNGNSVNYIATGFTNNTQWTKSFYANVGDQINISYPQNIILSIGESNPAIHTLTIINDMNGTLNQTVMSGNGYNLMNSGTTSSLTWIVK